MAGLFGGPERPQYVDPAGNAVTTQAGTGGFLGIFPGNPDYTAPTVPSAPTAPTKPTPTTPSTTEAASVEVAIRIPGVLSLQGALTVPAWVRDQAPALLPLVLRILMQRIDAEACRDVPRADDGGGCDPADLGYGPCDPAGRPWEYE